MNIEEIKELIEKKQFTKLKEELKEMKSADISTILDELDKEQAVIIFRLLSKEKAGMTFSYMETDMREKLIKDLTDTELKNVLDELFMDDTVDLIEEMPSNVVTRILRNVDKNDRKVINELLKYPEDSAGSIMTTEFIDLKEKSLSKGELQSVKKAIGLENLINKNSKDYKKLNMDKIRGAETREELLLKNSTLYVTPIVRNGKEATVGNSPEVWKSWE